MMTAAGHKRHRLRLTSKNRRDGSDIGQMGTAMERVIAEQGFTALLGIVLLALFVFLAMDFGS